MRLQDSEIVKDIYFGAEGRQKYLALIHDRREGGRVEGVKGPGPEPRRGP